MSRLSTMTAGINAAIPMTAHNRRGAWGYIQRLTMKVRTSAVATGTASADAARCNPGSSVIHSAARRRIQ